MEMVWRLCEGTDNIAPQRQSPGECYGERAGTPRIVQAGPSSVKGTRP
jgi:hypothetical protein